MDFPCGENEPKRKYFRVRIVRPQADVKHPKFGGVLQCAKEHPRAWSKKKPTVRGGHLLVRGGAKRSNEKGKMFSWRDKERRGCLLLVEVSESWEDIPMVQCLFFIMEKVGGVCQLCVCVL